MESNSKDLTQALNKTKIGIFLDKYAVFLGSILCSTQIVFNKECKTAYTNGKEIVFNPEYFMELTEPQRKALLLHELWHIARLHPIRAETRDIKQWNKACDYIINNALVKQGYDIKSMGGYVDESYEDFPEESVYEILYKQQLEDDEDNTEDVLGANDLKPEDTGNGTREIIQKVLTAQKAAERANAPGLSAGDGISNGIENLLNEFLKPKVSWRVLLEKYLTSLAEPDESTWARPNRRYPNIYLPSKTSSEHNLAHLAYFLDVSGSITQEQIKQFNSEVRYIKKIFNPAKLSLIQFDTEILKVQEFTDAQDFENISIVYGAGTSYEPVHDYIMEHQPTCAVIFTDLYCEDMEPVGKIPVIWIGVDTNQESVPFGKLIKITSEE